MTFTLLAQGCMTQLLYVAILAVPAGIGLNVLLIQQYVNHPVFVWFRRYISYVTPTNIVFY